MLELQRPLQQQVFAVLSTPQVGCVLQALGQFKPAPIGPPEVTQLAHLRLEPQ
jgi:hypothetical protein